MIIFQIFQIIFNYDIPDVDNDVHDNDSDNDNNVHDNDDDNDDSDNDENDDGGDVNANQGIYESNLDNDNGDQTINAQITLHIHMKRFWSDF